MCVLRKIYLFSECHDIATVIVLTRSLTEKVRRRNTREAEAGHTQERQGRKDLGRDQDQRIEGKSEATPEIGDEVEVVKEREAETEEVEVGIGEVGAGIEGAGVETREVGVEIREVEIVVGEEEAEAAIKTEKEAIQGHQMFRDYLK